MQYLEAQQSRRSPLPSNSLTQRSMLMPNMAQHHVQYRRREKTGVGLKGRFPFRPGSVP
jgi:hypothetical protein